MRLLERIQVLPLDVLDQRHGQRGRVVDWLDQHRYQVEPSKLSRPNDDTSHDERLAQQLQAYYDQENHAPVIAQPLRAAEMPYNCGHCGQTHLVRNVVHNSAFACTRCGRQNRIMLENLRQPVVVV